MLMIRMALTAILLVVAGSELAGCGKKGDLEPPPHTEETKIKKEGTIVIHASLEKVSTQAHF